MTNDNFINNQHYKTVRHITHSHTLQTKHILLIADCRQIKMAIGYLLLGPSDSQRCPICLLLPVAELNKMLGI